LPYTNEHSVRLLDPSIDHIRVCRTKDKGSVQNVKIPDTISIIWFIQKDDDGKETPRAQALRFPVSNWTESEARTWLKDNKIRYKLFEPAESEKKDVFYKAVNSSDNELDIAIHDEIGFTDETTSQAFYDLLSPNIKTINIDINSPGGAVRDGLSIYEQLKSHPAKINIKVSGVAASIASVIAMAGDTVKMPETSIMMIHKPLIPFLIAANSDKLRKSAEALDVMERSVIKAYKTRMDKDESEISEMLRDETWLNADEAVELGLADEVTDDVVDVMNYHDFKKFDYKNVPAAAMSYSIDANDDIGDLTTPIGDDDSLIKKVVAKIKDIMFEDEIDKPSTQKETDMDQAAIDAVNAENSALKAENKTLKTEIDNLKETVGKMETAQAEKDKESRGVEFKVFIDEQVKEGRVRPVDVDQHLETMELKFQTKDGEKAVDNYKEWVKSLPKVVDTSGEHVADKNVASNNNTDDKLELLTQKIMAEKKMTYSAALREAYSQHPEYLKKD